jgi:hypothetical protein
MSWRIGTPFDVRVPMSCVTNLSYNNFFVAHINLSALPMPLGTSQLYWKQTVGSLSKHTRLEWSEQGTVETSKAVLFTLSPNSITNA